MTPKEELTKRLDDLQMQLNSLKTELERISNVMNIDHAKLNQLTQQFKAHRDKKDIHEVGII